MPIVEALVVLSINVHRIDCSIFGQPPPEVEMLVHKKIPGLGLSSASEKKPVALRRWNFHRNCAQHLKAIVSKHIKPKQNTSKLHPLQTEKHRPIHCWNDVILSIHPGKLWKINLGTWKSPNYAEENHLPNSKPKPGMLGFSWICSFASAETSGRLSTWMDFRFQIQKNKDPRSPVI